jgi:hypothetical protein
MMSLASSPGTAVDPMWSSRSASRCSAGSALAILFISRAACRGHSGSAGTSTGPRFLSARAPAARFRVKGSSRSSQSRSTCVQQAPAQCRSCPGLRRPRPAGPGGPGRPSGNVRPLPSFPGVPACAGAGCPPARPPPQRGGSSLACPVSTRSGMSCTTTASSWRAAITAAARPRTSGWTIPLRTARRSGLPNTMAPSFGRSRRPSPSRIMSGPNSARRLPAPQCPVPLLPGPAHRHRPAPRRDPSRRGHH